MSLLILSIMEREYKMGDCRRIAPEYIEITLRCQQADELDEPSKIIYYLYSNKYSVSYIWRNHRPDAPEVIYHIEPDALEIIIYGPRKPKYTWYDIHGKSRSPYCQKL